MKKILFALPLCILLANCSSSRKATTPPAGPGISNVNVSENGAAATPVNASMTNSTNRDFAYKSKYDTSLSGNWVLQGMMNSSGTWTSTNTDTAITAAPAMAMTDTAATMTNTNMSSGNNPMTTTNGKSKGKSRVNNRALYDSAKARLSLNVQSPPATIDSSLVGPYKYWGHTPMMQINAANRVFYGSTGCNSMSGSFNFSDNAIRFGKTINTSKMNCNEYDEASFLQALKKVDSYTLNGNMLELKQGNNVLLSFAKK